MLLGVPLRVRAGYFLPASSFLASPPVSFLVSFFGSVAGSFFGSGFGIAFFLGAAATSGSITFLKVSNGCAPSMRVLPMMKVGVERMLYLRAD